ncbi:MAG: hypothetical protein JWN83_351 [Chitinophagaceae bacterium]|nr:hypothetical protein [Chitinophagaceae bacterium]
MHSLITSYLLQSKECILPGIGILQVINTPASTDAATRRLLPPSEEIIFRKESHSKSPGLVKYIVGKKHIQQSEAEELLNDFCKEWKEKINAGEKLDLEGIGSIQKNTDGIISFEKENSFNFLQPIIVDNLYKSVEEPLLIDKDPEVNEYKEEEEVIVERGEKSYWGLWALILLAIGSVVIFYHFKDYKIITGSSVGNQHKYIIDSAGATYQLPK